MAIIHIKYTPYTEKDTPKKLKIVGTIIIIKINTTSDFMILIKLSI